MNFYSPSAIKELLAQHGVKPSKRLGQNFLIDQRALEKVIAAADLGPKDTVVEIGPGIGTLTQALAQKAGRVIALEKDGAMVDILGKTLQDFKNIKVIHSDVLEDFKFQISNYKVVANIPYYITSPIIRLFLEANNPPQSMVLMVQKEVAQRIVAQPPNMSILAVSVQFYATAKIISYVPKGCFWPAPSVDSAIIKITPTEKARGGPTPANSADFFRVVKAGFLHPRKKLINNLTEGLNMEKEQTASWLLDNHIDPAQRAETLTIQDWQRLTQKLDKSA